MEPPCLYENPGGRPPGLGWPPAPAVHHGKLRWPTGSAFPNLGEQALTYRLGVDGLQYFGDGEAESERQPFKTV